MFHCTLIASEHIKIGLFGQFGRQANWDGFCKSVWYDRILIGKMVVPLGWYGSCLTPPRSPLKGDIRNKYPLYKVYMGLIIKGTIPRVPPFSLWDTLRKANMEPNLGSSHPFPLFLNQPNSTEGDTIPQYMLIYFGYWIGVEPSLCWDYINGVV